MKRRELLKSLGATLTTLSAGPHALAAAATPQPLRAAPHRLPAAGQQALDVWAYEGAVPGPPLRFRRGDMLDVELLNALADSTTVHFHGVRMPNAMDGVPDLTQPAVRPGERFRYRFALQDSGTFWYHPHLGAPEQLARGLYGALIVDDEDGPEVDRELVWVLTDWRLDAQGQIADDFYDFMDVSHAGRLGQVVTINGQRAPQVEVRNGERIRLRLINVANARLFALRFDALTPWLIGLDNAPLDAAQAIADPLLLGPGMRADLILDIAHEPGARIRFQDVFRRVSDLAQLQIVGAMRPGRTARDAPQAPARNPLPEPRLDEAKIEPIIIGGGMMSMSGWPKVSPAERASRWLRRLGGAKEATPAWTINGAAHSDHLHEPEFSVPRDRTVVIRFENHTAFWHPMHLHGHSFRELRRNGREVPGRPWRDTTLLPPRQDLEIAFFADNPGDWLIHCHVLEHHAGGLGTTFRVLA